MHRPQRGQRLPRFNFHGKITSIWNDDRLGVVIFISIFLDVITPGRKLDISMDIVTECYQKPFHLFHYNKPKQPELPKIRKIKKNTTPKIPLRLNNATKLRNKVIKMYSATESNPYVNYRELTEQSEQKVFDTPQHAPKQTKTSQYRYKWVRDVPVVSCRFTEYCMMYKKPPFTFEKTIGPSCGQFKLRRMQIESPQKSETETIKTESTPSLPSILQ